MTLCELKALAEKATPGPWTHDSMQSGTEYVGMRTAIPGKPINPDHSDGNGYVGAHMFLYDAKKFQEPIEKLHDEKWNNAAFIAAANPDTVKQLIERVNKLSEAIRTLEAGLEFKGVQATPGTVGCVIALRQFGADVGLK